LTLDCTRTVQLDSRISRNARKVNETVLKLSSVTFVTQLTVIEEIILLDDRVFFMADHPTFTQMGNLA